jgi:PPM family protein phosphatase
VVKFMPGDPAFLAALAGAILVIAFVYWRARVGDAVELKAANDAPSPPPDVVSGVSSSSPAPPAASGSARVAAPAEEASPSALAAPALPKIDYGEDADVDPTLVGVPAREAARSSSAPPTQKIVYDEDAALEDPTQPGELILVTATGQTDKGLRRKRNEDNLLALEDDGVFVVADGMGGYRGGEIASHLAVTTIERAFTSKKFEGPQHDTIPLRASELARAIQMANEAIFTKAASDKRLDGMGTTICAARFSKNKQRVYIGHVGDSRVYRMRDGKLFQMTSDHTMEQLGVNGEGAGHLSRAVGVWPIVPIDIVLGKPQPGDVYLLCSDGLSKMVPDDQIEQLLRQSESPAAAAETLIQAANERGGKDNVTVIVVRVDAPLGLFRPHAA